MSKNMSPKKVPIPEQAPDVRNKNFNEVTLGYTSGQAMEEAARCIQCKHRPCINGCPVGIAIPDFIAKIKEGDFQTAYEILLKDTSLPAICGRVCPQESQCEKNCVRGIKGEPVGIGRLERFAADFALHNENQKTEHPPSNGIKVAVIGAGPAGLACAGELAKRGYEVTIFEAFHIAGGVLVYGIPEFRLPKSIVSREVEGLKALGIQIMTNMVIGKTLTIDELFEEMGFSAVFIGSGAGLPSFMGIEGEGLSAVYSANEFLTRVNLMKAYDQNYDTPIKHSKSVAVVGGGNVAMDAARCAKRLGAEKVTIVYRRSEDEMPARREEIHHAKEEGILFELLSSPVKIIGDDEGNVLGMECVRMTLSEPDESGRRRPVVLENSNFVLDVDSVIIAIGTSPNPLIGSSTNGLKTNARGCIAVDENTMATSREGVFAGGDTVTGAATVILAMGAGKLAADSIDKYIKSKQ